jgi:GH25 family lysozyme M1 (1,4-beta-N-acetylmuramidase)
VSAYQPGVDWQQVARAGFAFAFVKATESTGYTNPFFSSYWTEIQQNGLVRGAYHFAHPDDGQAAAEAAYFASVVSPQAGDLMVLDLEVGTGDCQAWAIQFAQALNFPVMLYSGVPFMQAHNLDNAETAAAFGGKLWIAAYSSNPPNLPAGWPELTFWQYSDRESVAGIGACDCSIYLP